jgi:type IV pilus assembly protein PilV
LQLNRYRKPGSITQAGGGLIEVLIALLLMMTSALGYIALEVTSMKSITTSQIRTQATVIAYGIADGLRANSDEADSGSYDGDLSEPGAQECEGTGSTCTATQLVAYDQGQWMSVLGLLPGGQVNITRVEDTGNSTNEYTVSVCWNESRESTTGNCSAPSGENPLANFVLRILL